MSIFLKDIFDFDSLLGKYPKRRIKLRFNTNWKDDNKYYDFVEMYRSKSEYFEPYILNYSEGKRKRNQPNDIQFEFIEVESHRWLFVGAYVIIDPSRKKFKNEFGDGTFSTAVAERLPEYDKYVEKVLVDWTNKPQQFFYVNNEIINNVELYAITSKPYFEQENDFPGYDNLCMSYFDLRKQWNGKAWHDQLSAIYGVYLITDTKTGMLYVGSAYGDEGVYGRWSVYLADGYDKNEVENSKYPNVELKKLVESKGIEYIQKNFQYTLLEIFSKNDIGKQRALERENYWKNVTHSRVFGYNKN